MRWLNSVCVLLTVTLGLLVGGSAGAASMTYNLDAYFISGGPSIILDQGSFTANDATGEITAFRWDAFGGFGALDETNISFASATFSAGVLTELSILADDGTTYLALHPGDGNGGPASELTTSNMFAIGSYGVRNASGATILGGPAASVPEPTGAVLFAAGLLTVGRTMRRRRRS